MLSPYFHAVLLQYFISCSHNSQRTAHLLTSREPSTCPRSLESATVLNLSNESSPLLVSVPPEPQRSSFYTPLLSSSAPSSSTHVLTWLRQSEPETLEVSRAAELFQTTLQVLTNTARQRYKRDLTAAGRTILFD